MKAFPQSNDLMLDGKYQGMDLRDYFACNAPVYIEEAFESLGLQTKTTLTDKYDEEVFSEVARLSYIYANAMMKAREKK